MTEDIPQLSFSITCSACKDTYKAVGKHRNAFEFMADGILQGWLIPMAVENKPIKCPKCQIKPTP